MRSNMLQSWSLLARPARVCGVALAAIMVTLAVGGGALVPQKALAATNEVEDNGNFATATPLSVGDTVYGMFLNDGDQDYYLINSLVSGPAYLTFSNDRVSESGHMTGCLYDQNKKNPTNIQGMFFNKVTSYTQTVVLNKGINYLQLQQGGWTTSYNHPYHFKLTYAVYGTSISKVSAASKAFTVKWTKKSDATKYQVRYSTKKNMAKAKTVNVSKSSSSKKITKLKAKKKYYVQVRVVKTIGGQNYYSSWSTAKVVKTKK